ncbi:MAG TPA: hypothetical protein VKT28_04115 [Puia sp.]|nr:hypothetical protein [Puia sp.]
MKEAKIKLSEDELKLVQNADIILTKNVIIQKAISLFSELSENMQAEISKIDLPEDIKSSSPKISKGENYKGLPYVILDYPRLFNHENIFAIRSFFWWGNYFSTTLHLKGNYKEMYARSILKNISLLAKKGFSISASLDEWIHEHEDNYISLSRITENELTDIMQSKSFLKISAVTALSQWDNVEVILMGLFKDVLQSIGQH